jgi:hypothetical protein
MRVGQNHVLQQLAKKVMWCVIVVVVLCRCHYEVTAFRPVGALRHWQSSPTATAPCLNGQGQSGTRRLHECLERTARDTRRPHEIPISSSPLVCFALSSLDNAQSSAAFDDDSKHVESPQPMNMENPETTTSPYSSIPGYKLRRLKVMWVRETLEDLTAAEFACTVETVGADDDDSTTTGSSGRPKRKKRAVDYEKATHATQSTHSRHGLRFRHGKCRSG